MPQLLCAVPKGLLTREKKRTMLREIIEATHKSVGWRCTQQPSAPKISVAGSESEHRFC
jgi:hypothetical protein